jgi:hypothetical protein
LLGGKKINKPFNLFVVTTLVFFAFGSFFFSCPSAIAQTDQVTSKLQAANTAINQAFNAVLDAEKAGANVTALLAQLNSAGYFLAQANISYRIRDYNTAEAHADSVLQIAQIETAAAQDARQAAFVSGQNAFWFLIAFTAIGSVVFISVLFLVWRRFKRHYISKSYKVQPEVASP